MTSEQIPVSEEDSISKSRKWGSYSATISLKMYVLSFLIELLLKIKNSFGGNNDSTELNV
jgi:hypothetical protein